MKTHSPDYPLVVGSTILILLGILILASVSVSFAQEKYGSTYYFLKHQIIYGIIPGLFLGFLAYKFPLSLLKKLAFVFFVVNLIFLALVFAPEIGTKLGGAARWVNLGPISFQPSEFLKLTFILYLAAWMASRTKKAGSVKIRKDVSATLIAFMISTGLVSLFLIFQPDISTLGIIVLMGMLIYFFSGAPVWHSMLMILIGTGGLLVLVKIASYRFNRLLVFLNPELDPMGIGYQVKQALIAIGSGGIFGLGLGMSRQKFGFLPQSISDSVFAIFAEETGFIGGAILIILFLFFVWRGFKVAKSTQDKFLQLTALGISSWIGIQAFINIGAMIGILPLTGIPLPFVSFGGSHIITEFVGLGILLNISKNI